MNPDQMPTIQDPQRLANDLEPARSVNGPIDQATQEAEAPAPIEFSWHASEYVQHHKTSLWYLGVIGVVIVLSFAAWLLKSWLSIVLFFVMGAAVIVYARRPPRTLHYELSADGLTIDGKLFAYSTFRSFSVMRDVSWHTIDLEPTQRFMPPLSMLFDDGDFEPIVSHLVQHLPRVDRDLDIIERATRYIRF